MKCPDWGEPDDLTPQEAIVEAILAEEAASPSPLSVETLQGWHRRLFIGRVSVDYYAGGIRQRDPRWPCLGRNVMAAGGMGSHFTVVPEQLTAFCAKTERALGRVALWQMPPEKKALALTQLLAEAMTTFLRLHPFLDGNSRMARLLLTVLTRRLELPRMMSVLPPGHPDFGALKQASMRADAGPWRAFLIEALARPETVT